MTETRVSWRHGALLFSFTSWYFENWVGSKVGGVIVGLFCGRNYFQD